MNRQAEMAAAIEQAEEAEALEETRPYVRPRPPKEASQVYSVRIPVSRIEQLRDLASRRGEAPTALLREWVLDRLAVEERTPAEVNAQRSDVEHLSAAFDPAVIAVIANQMTAVSRELQANSRSELAELQRSFAALTAEMATTIQREAKEINRSLTAERRQIEREFKRMASEAGRAARVVAAGKDAAVKARAATKKAAKRVKSA